MWALFRKLKRQIADLLGRFCEEGGIYYIGGSDALPQPLTKEEENELIARMQEDERAKNMLIERNLRLVVYIARKFENTGIYVEDLISIGTIGLIKAINTFKPDKILSLQPMRPGASKMKF